MTTRLMNAFLMMTTLWLGLGGLVGAHAGHDHKVMGTITMAAADHVMLKDTDGKDVTVHVTKDTKVKASPMVKVADIKAGTRVVITATMEKDQMKAKLIEVGASGKP